MVKLSVINNLILCICVSLANFALTDTYYGLQALWGLVFLIVLPLLYYHVSIKLMIEKIDRPDIPATIYSALLFCIEAIPAICMCFVCDNPKAIIALLCIVAVTLTVYILHLRYLYND